MFSTDERCPYCRALYDTERGHICEPVIVGTATTYGCPPTEEDRLRARVAELESKLEEARQMIRDMTDRALERENRLGPCELVVRRLVEHDDAVAECASNLDGDALCAEMSRLDEQHASIIADARDLLSSGVERQENK